MVSISAKTFAKSHVHTIQVKERGKELFLWIRIKDIGKK